MLSNNFIQNYLITAYFYDYYHTNILDDQIEHRTY